MDEKALTVLKIAALPVHSLERRTAYGAACGKYSEQAVLDEFDGLLRNGYIMCIMSARTGWLTDAGRAVLERLGG